MDDRPTVRISEREPTGEELAWAANWSRGLVKDSISEQTDYALMLCFFLTGLAIVVAKFAAPGLFYPAMGVGLVLAMIVAVRDIVRRVRLGSIGPEKVRGKIVCVTVSVEKWWRIEADNEREADVLVQFGPGLQIYGHKSVPLSRTPTVEGAYPGQQLTLNYFVLTTIPLRSLLGHAALIGVVAQGQPDEPGEPVKWGNLFTRAYDIGVYEEQGDGVGSYPWPTAIELIADLASPGVRESVRVIDERTSPTSS